MDVESRFICLLGFSTRLTWAKDTEGTLNNIVDLQYSLECSIESENNLTKKMEDQSHYRVNEHLLSQNNKHVCEYDIGMAHCLRSPSKWVSNSSVISRNIRPDGVPPDVTELARHIHYTCARPAQLPGKVFFPLYYRNGQTLSIRSRVLSFRNWTLDGKIHSVLVVHYFVPMRSHFGPWKSVQAELKPGWAVTLKRNTCMFGY